MRTLLKTTLRLVVLNLAVIVLTAWGLSHWFVVDFSVRVPGTQVWIRCDSGGWLADIRLPAVAGPSWMVNCDISTPAELTERHSSAELPFNISEFRPTIDAFDRAAFWSYSLPGLRFLKENNGSRLVRRHRLAFGIRHPLLFVLASMATAFYCMVGRAAVTWARKPVSTD